MLLIALFGELKGGGFAPGRLPFPGGRAQQPACVMASLGVVAEAERALRKAFPMYFAEEEGRPNA